MKKIFTLIAILSIPFFLSCSLFVSKNRLSLTQDEISAAQKTNISIERALELKEKKLYELNPKDMNEYLGYIQNLIPDVPNRVMHLARKNLGQQYKIYLLGEFPFEIYDTDPLFCLEKSDCLVFTEHIYAMSLAKDWQQFFSLLQRIRYKDGEISTTTRNHSTIPQWIENNNWLIEDIMNEIDPMLTRPIQFKFNPNNELISDYKVNPNFPTQEVSTSYIPLDNISKIIDKLKPGDFVNVIRGFEEPNLWCSHVGFITKNEDGTVNFLDSAEPVVRETPLLEYVERCRKNNESYKINNKLVDERKKNPDLNKGKKFLFFKSKEKSLKKKPLHFGFKFYHIETDPIKNLIDIDGADAPRVTGPKGLLINRKDIPVK